MIYDNLKARTRTLLINSNTPLSKSEIARALNIPIYWVTKLLSGMPDVKEVQISPSRYGYTI